MGARVRNAPAARFTVGRKVVAGLTVVVALGFVSMLMLYRGLNAVENAVNRLAEVEGPLSAAAYEMEVNVNGIGLAVLKYLATGRPEYRAWVEQDNTDFRNYHATYERLVGTRLEKELSAEIAVYYDEFSDLTTTLMRMRDEQAQLFVAVSSGIEEIDRIIDRDLAYTGQPSNSSRKGSVDTALAVANLEAEAAEIGFWLAVYQRFYVAQARDMIYQKMMEFERELARLMRGRLDARERALAETLRSTYGGIAGQVHAVVALEDEIKQKRERFVGLRVSMDRLLDNEIQILLAQGLDRPRRDANAAADKVIATMRYLIPMFVLAAALVGYLLVRSLLGPLRRLKSGTEAVGRGDLEYRIAPLTNDEFGELARDFNRMVVQLRETTVSRHLLASSEAKLKDTVADLRHQISERERAEREREGLQARLRRTETMSEMGALVAGVAHEVRNPLFGISSTLDAMDARLGERPEYGRYRDVLRGEVNRLGKLMSDLLDFGKPASETSEPGQVEDVVDRAVESCAPLAASREVTIDNCMPARTAPIQMARNRLMQVFVNLIENAVQHSPRGSTVRIDAQETQADGRRWIDCAVRDAGSGIRASDLPRLFEPFFTRRRGGTGLGLSIVQRVVEEHGGQVLVSNHSEGGALLTVRLPVAPS